jgi:DNA invertase Pin-like site-specific DNA recombinase
MKKVVLLIRVSTVYKSYDAQTRELVEFVKFKGYNDNEMIIIQDKESGTKLPDEERNGLNELWKAINEHPIECVFCWELSRLSRNPGTLYKVRDKLKEHKINLRIKQEDFSLLNENMELDYHNNRIFST